MKVEVKVDWGASPANHNRETTAEPVGPPRLRADRRLWYIAVGREIEGGIDSGRFSSYADAARACKVSRARISQMTHGSGL